MNFQLRFPLRDLLRGATTGEYTEVQLRELHRLAYSLARHLVRRKIASGKLRLNLIGLSESDITHDCIAELFTRDENGVLVEIKKFFHDQQIFIEEMPDEALLIQFRRLTFTMVKDGVFRLYHEADPTLAKILRNLKAALGKSPTWSIADRFDEQYAEVISTPTHTNLPSIDDDELERFLCQHSCPIDVACPGN
ncbi:MAG: hypothetical protein HY277_03015 [Ignavibacteriales bacterium]|nr:hypothetical protein [Ignavibacteriales bacterium]